MPDSNVPFRSVLRGYDPAEVDQHMKELAQASAAVWQEAAERAAQVSELKAANGRLKGEVQLYAQRNRALEETQREASAPSYEGLGERIGSILTLVDEEAHELRTRAQAYSANHHALADESALATRQDADDYSLQTRDAADDEVAQLLADARVQADSLQNDARQHADSLQNDARQHADSLQDDADRQAMARQDADRQAMVRREETEAAYELARARSAAAAVDFETTLAARRDTSALEFAAQVAAAEQQLAAVRLRSEQTRSDYEQAQQESASKAAQQLEQAMAHSRTLVAEAKTKAERIRSNSERELVAATQRRDSINAQLSTVRHDLAALGGVTRLNPLRLAEPEADAGQIEATAVAGQKVVTAVQVEAGKSGSGHESGAKH
jgi:DivIVA domain-containing protein